MLTFIIILEIKRRLTLLNRSIIYTIKIQYVNHVDNLDDIAITVVQEIVLVTDTV